MDDPPFGGLGQGGGRLPHDAQGQLQIGRAAADEQFVQVLPLDVFLGDEVHAVGAAHLVDLHDVGMDQ